MTTAKNYYETDRAVSEYLLFHYGPTGETSFPVRCARECLAERLPAKARALDLGCAVGGSAFELARKCAEVVAIDYSKRFIAVAQRLRKQGSIRFGSVEEGELIRPDRASVPAAIDRERVQFERGDAMNLPRNLGAFDVVLMANLIDRLADPRRCLKRLPGLVKPGGHLVIISPYTWLAEYTPRKNWLGGFVRGGKRIKTFDSLKQILLPDFELLRRRDMPFLIREHARKYQLGIAEAGVWRRRGNS
jgi:putative 4-mercaptohistidine N1-methyltranferase